MSSVAHNFDRLQWAVDLGTPVNKNGVIQVGLPVPEMLMLPKRRLVVSPQRNRYYSEPVGFRIGWRAPDQDEYSYDIDPNDPVSVVDGTGGMAEYQPSIINPGLPGGFVLSKNMTTGVLEPKIGSEYIQDTEKFNKFIGVVSIRALKKFSDRLHSSLIKGPSPYC